MSDLLHSVHALRDLATSAPEPARSWAAALAGLWQGPGGPWPTIPHPLGPWGWTPLLRAHPTLPEPGTPASPALAEAVRLAPGLGVPVPAHLVQTLREGFDQVDAADRPGLALALALHGALEPSKLRAAAAHADRPTLAALVLHVGTATGQGASAAAEALPPLDDNEVEQLLALLAVPGTSPSSADPSTLVQQVAADLGVPLPSPPRTRGSRGRRARAWIHLLLDDHDTAVSHALRAAADPRRAPRLLGTLVRLAAVLALYQPTEDPVQDVLTRHAIAHPATLAQARTAPPVPWPDTPPPHPDAFLLLAPLDDDEARDAALTWRPDLAPAWVPAAPDALPDALHRDAHRDSALVCAAWCPTLDVLQALLDLPVPHDPLPRRALAWALACMGDPVAATHLRGLAEADPDLDVSVPVALVTALGL